MLHEFRDVITTLKSQDAHFAKMFEKHNDLDNQLENKAEHLSDLEAEKIKKEKLALKDAIYAQIMKFKADNNF
jgi:uncharacterized protein YdcH (DUF465 family)